MRSLYRLHNNMVVLHTVNTLQVANTYMYFALIEQGRYSKCQPNMRVCGKYLINLPTDGSTSTARAPNTQNRATEDDAICLFSVSSYIDVYAGTIEKLHLEGQSSVVCFKIGTFC